MQDNTTGAITVHSLALGRMASEKGYASVASSHTERGKKERCRVAPSRKLGNVKKIKIIIYILEAKLELVLASLPAHLFLRTICTEGWCDPCIGYNL